MSSTQAIPWTAFVWLLFCGVLTVARLPWSDERKTRLKVYGIGAGCLVISAAVASVALWLSPLAWAFVAGLRDEPARAISLVVLLFGSLVALFVIVASFMGHVFCMAHACAAGDQQIDTLI